MRIPFSEDDKSALMSFIYHAETLFGKEHLDEWFIRRGPDSATVTLRVGDVTMTGTGATVADAVLDISKALVQKFPSGSATPS